MAAELSVSATVPSSPRCDWYIRKQPHRTVGLFAHGPDGSRTRVQKPIRMNIYMLSRSLVFNDCPLSVRDSFSGNRQNQGIRTGSLQIPSFGFLCFNTGALPKTGGYIGAYSLMRNRTDPEGQAARA